MDLGIVHVNHADASVQNSKRNDGQRDKQMQTGEPV